MYCPFIRRMKWSAIASCAAIWGASIASQSTRVALLRKHFAPFREAMERKQKHAQLLSKPERQRLVVRPLGGHALRIASP